MRLPALAFLAALIVFPLYPKIGLLGVPGTYIPVRLDDVVVVIIGAIWLISRARARRWPELPRVVALLAGAWVALGLLALLIGAFVLNTISFVTGLAYWVKPLEYFLLGAIAYDLVRRRELPPRALLLVVFGAAAIVVGYGLLERIGVVPRLPGTSPIPGAILSTIGDPHALATYLGVIIVVGLAFWPRIEGRSRVVLLVGLIGACLVMFLSGARTEWLALFACLIGFALWRPVRRGALLTAAVVLLITVAVPLAQLAVTRLGEPGSVVNPPGGGPTTGGSGEVATVTDRFFEAAAASSLGTRLLVRWPAMIEAGMRNPLVGIGPSAATEAADNYYIRSFVEVGILGTLAFLAMLYALTRGLWRTRFAPDPLVASMARGVFVATIFLTLVGFLIDTWVASRVMDLYWPLAGAVLGAGALGAASGTDGGVNTTTSLAHD